MMSYTLPDLIDNSDPTRRLREALEYLLSTGADVSIVTGYFNLAGYNLIQTALERAGKIRILIGKEPDIASLGGTPKEEYFVDEIESDLQSENIIGTRQSRDNVRSFLLFLQNPHVEMAIYTKRFLHAKCYIIQNVPHFGSVAVVGSSNFTRAGLTQNTELNMVQKQKGAVDEFLRWFESVWEDRIDYKPRIIELYENASDLQSPFLIYLKSLYEILKDQLAIDDVTPSDAHSPVILANFQQVGYENAKQALETFQGVLIADSVGFGKTYLALRLLDDYAYQLRQKALVVCPAQLRDLVWEKKLSDYSIKADVVSQEKLSQDNFLEQLDKDYDLVVVDESHNFRNPNAKRSENLLTLLTQGKQKKVVLLTATPINTSVFDLYHQLRYLTCDQDDYLAGLGIQSLKGHFIESEKNPELMVDVLDHISVRRSREFIRQTYKEVEIEGRVMRFPKRDLHKIDYNLQQTYEGLYEDASAVIQQLVFAPYLLEFFKKDIPQSYRQFLYADQSVDFSSVPNAVAMVLGRQWALAGIMRFLYLKRLESSVASLKISLERQSRFQRQFLDQLKKGRLLASKDLRRLESIMRKIDDSEDDEGDFAFDETDERIAEILEQLLPVDAAEYDLESIQQAVQHDIDTLKRVLDKLSLITDKDDDKLVALKRHLVTTLRDKKVIVFSYFKDTARYIYNNLVKDTSFLQELGHARISICDSKISVQEKKERVINFSPTTYGRPEIKGTEQEIDLLISTDVLSEGQNLQDSGALINYDLHWNPVRMVQRAGRIDRLGSEFETVHIYNFNPEDALESLLNLVKRLSERLSAINSAGLLDATVMGEIPTPRNFGDIRRIANADSSIISELENISELNVGEFLKQELLSFIKRLGKENLEKILSGSGSAKKSSTGHKGLFVHLIGGSQHFLMFWDENQKKWLEHRVEVMKIIRCTESEPIAALDMDIYPIIERARERVVSRLRQAKVKLPRLESPQNYIVSVLNNQRDQNAISSLVEYYNEPLPAQLLKKIRKIWQQNKGNDSNLLLALNEFSVQNPITRPDRPEILELCKDDLKLVCYMAVV